MHHYLEENLIGSTDNYLKKLLKYIWRKKMQINDNDNIVF
jgi:hypothetical protein